MTNKSEARGFLIPLRIITLAAEQGVKLQALQGMLRKSARITHPLGNRRYHEWVFMVEGNRVLDMGLIEDGPVVDYADDEPPPEEDLSIYKCYTCKDDHKIQVFNECPRCEGGGCKRCDDGLVPSAIPCPDCTRQKTAYKRRK
jgi:hypothetical protein